MKVDWCNGRWGTLIPYSSDADQDGYTHFLSFTASSGSRSVAITEAVLEWADHADEVVLTKNAYELFRRYRKHRDQVWRKLYAKGFRVVRLKVRAG